MATHADADLILRLYDLRREAEMRRARSFLAQFQPASAAEAQAAHSGIGRQDNAWVRQATSYWEMAFSIANTGAIDETLFAKNCGEGILFAVKCQILKAKFPEAWNRTMPEAEAFIARNATAQQKAEQMRKRLGG
ncbi:hypothetical protein LBMAG53_26720 [Planctomycetota bacterium]|nr:hypothetical protein LBMAG53_26720 [Planctomycetota bacterium]